MNEAPTFSLLMAVYNAAPYLMQAIESVLAQSISCWELLCVDDGSTDDSLSILREYAARDERVRLIPSSGKNQGPAKARNLALQQARGQYVAMLDADDWLSSDALQRLCDDFEAYSLADCVMFTLVEEYPSHHCLYGMPYQVGDSFTGKEAFRLSLDWRLHGVYAVRRELHLRYPYDDSCRLHSDDNTTRIHFLHSREVRIGAGEYHYRKRPDSISFVIGMDHFGYLDANLSMKRLLHEAYSRDGLVDASDLAFYEQHRWLRYVDMHWFLFLHRQKFLDDEKRAVRSKLFEIYRTFDGDFGCKFGYTRYKKYNLFLLQEWLYFRMRWLLGRR